jgi:hypothetical protein
MSTPATDAHAAIMNVFIGMLHAIDAQDWNAVRAAFADSVTTDYTSLFGGEVETPSADALVDGWAAFLPGFDATQHLAGPLVVQVDGDTASARCAVTATHRIDSARWIVGGHYHSPGARRGWLAHHASHAGNGLRRRRPGLDRASRRARLNRARPP